MLGADNRIVIIVFLKTLTISVPSLSLSLIKGELHDSDSCLLMPFKTWICVQWAEKLGDVSLMGNLSIQDESSAEMVPCFSVFSNEGEARQRPHSSELVN